MSFSGLWFGALLAFISPEEMKPGMKYFEAMINIIFVIVVLLSAYLLRDESLFIPLLLIAMCLFFLFFSQQRYIFPMLGLFFYISSMDSRIFLLTASAIFLLGLPKGSIFAHEHKGMKRARIIRRVFILHCFFFVTALPLYFSNL